MQNKYILYTVYLCVFSSVSTNYYRTIVILKKFLSKLEQDHPVESCSGEVLGPSPAGSPRTCTSPRLYMAHKMKRESADHSMCWIWSRHVYSWRTCRVLTSRTTTRYWTQAAWERKRKHVPCSSSSFQSTPAPHRRGFRHAFCLMVPHSPF